MVRINLLDRGKRREKPSVDKGKVIAVFGIVAAVAAVSVIAFFAYNSLSEQGSVQKAGKQSTTADRVVNTSSRSDVVEEIVDGKAHHKSGIDIETGREYIPYNELTYNEKLNYEINFAREVFNLLARCLPKDAEFTEVHIKDYDTLVCKGIEETKENVKDIFWAFSGEKVAFDPKPKTYIRKNNGAFNYNIMVNLETGLDLRAPFIDLKLSFLPSEKRLYILNDRIRDIGESAGLSYLSGIEKLDSYNDGKHIKHNFRLECRGGYNEFVSFVKTLYSRKVPCAFERIDIKAVEPGIVTADCVIQYTTDE